MNDRLAGLTREEKLALVAELARKKAEQPKAHPLSFAQERLWFLHQLDPESFAHSLFRAFELRGKLHEKALVTAVRQLVERHGSLRTTFAVPEGGENEPQQIVAPASAAKDFALEFIDLGHLDEAECEAGLVAELRSEPRRPFDLEKGPLFRVRVLRCDDQRNVLTLTLHHIVVDGYSMGVLFRELAALYEAACEGVGADLNKLPIQYSDFSRWQRQELDLDQQLSFWRQELEGVPTVFELPGDRPRPALASLVGDLVPFTLDGALSQALRELGKRHGTTLFMTLTAVFEVLLWRYTGQRDFLFGIPIANRQRAELEGIVGSFANTLVLRADIDGATQETFLGLLKRVRRRALHAYDNQDVPFERLVEEISPQRDLSRNPLFQVMFAIVDEPGGGRLSRLGDLELAPVGVGRGLSKVDLTLEVIAGEKVAGYFEYSTDLFESSTIERLSEHFIQILRSVTENPEQRIDEIPLMDAEELRQSITQWNDTAVGYDLEPLHQLVSRQAVATPSAIAVVAAPAVTAQDSKEASPAAQLTFDELTERSLQLAYRLSRMGVHRGTRVGVLMERSLEAMVAWLGVLKVGAAWVPLDPSLPAERLEFIAADASVGVLLTQARLADRLPSVSKILALDEIWDETNVEPAQLPEVGLDDIAYVIYTSGSTGRPKGVEIPHRAVVNHAQAIVQRYELKPTDRVLQFASLSFDIAVEEVFPTWLAGACLVLRNEQQSLAFGDFFRLVEEWQVTVANLPTPYWHEWVSALVDGFPIPSELRLVIVGTEQALPERLRTWLATVGDRPTWINAYGPSETTITATAWNGAGKDPVQVPIGRPLANVQAYVVDAALRPVPPGVPGQLLIGGAGLGRGYIGRPGQTAAVFVPNPFVEESGLRLYATGDHVRQRLDGEILFLGRIDQQVKIRGFRIEVGEIEAVAADHEGVREVVVTAPEVAPGDRRLAAWVAVEEGMALGTQQLREYLSERIPAYMVPAAITILDALPRTRSGKIDRRALPEPDWGAGAGTETTAPRTPQEEILADIWQDVLHRPEVGVHDDFFELGGHSLLATRMLSRLRNVLGVDLPLRSVFEARTIADLARCLDDERRESPGLPPIRPVNREVEPPLSFAQQRMWFLHQLDPESPAYNMPAALELRGELNVEVFELALVKLFIRHESLRTSFPAERGEPRQRIIDGGASELVRVELDSAGTEEMREQAALAWTREESRRPFDLATGPLLRLALLRLTDDWHWLVFTFHHVISDGWSTDVFLRELMTLYHDLNRGGEGALPPLPIQYADYAAWQREHLRGELFEAQMGFWRQRLEGAPTMLELPTDLPRPQVQQFRGGRATFEISAEISEKLRGIGRERGASLFMICLAAYALLLERYSHQRDILIGTPVSGRHHPETEDLIGFFVNTLVLRAELGGQPSFLELVDRLRTTVLEAYAHQDLPFEQLVDELGIERNLSHTPLFQAVFVLHHVERRLAAKTQSDLRIRLPSIDNETSRFDLNMVLVERSEGLRGFLEYNSDLFEAVSIERMAANYARLLAAAVEAPELPVTGLSILGEEEARTVLERWHVAASHEPELSETLHGRFESQVELRPDAAAATCGEETLSYFELDQRANQLAHALIAHGVGPESRVALSVERNLDLVVGILGILKAGGGYVPVDPSSPEERLRFIIEDSRAKVLVTRQELAESLTGGPGGKDVLTLEDVEKQDDPVRVPTPRAGAANLAYVIYTSGSTGRPKGVSITHRNVLRLFDATETWFTPTHEDTWSLFHSFAFDFSVWELWGALLYGGRVVVVPYWVSRSAEEFYDLLVAEGVTSLSQTPSMFRRLEQVDEVRTKAADGVSPLSDLRLVVFGGEALDLQSLAPWWQRHPSDSPRMINMYGITETTVHVTYEPLGPELLERPAQSLIGDPIPDLGIYLLDAAQKPVPRGAAGEICVGGAGLARDYLARPALTAQRFLPNPWSEQPGERLYRSGDLGRLLNDGSLDYLGRIDHQVKIRGFRIELGEIESRLGEQEGVRQAVVLTRPEGKTGENRLVAWVALAPFPDEKSQAKAVQGLREGLAKTLPEYMVPSAFVLLPEIPLTQNGKVDRRALPEPEQGHGVLSTEFEAPATSVEEKLASIWQEVLGLEKVGRHDDFFELGGHSLLATQAMARTAEAFDVELPLRTLFEATSIAALAEEIVSREVDQADDDLLARLLDEL